MAASVHDALDQEEWRLEEIRLILECDSSSINEEREPKTAAYFRDGLVTPLHRVLMDKRCSEDIVQLLLHYGADPNRHVYVGRWGGTVSPLYLIIRSCLPHRGIRKNIDLLGIIIVFRSCLPQRSVGIEMLGVIRTLIEGGAKADQPDDWSLHFALSMNAEIEVIKLLLRAGADLLKVYDDEEVECPLFTALRHFDVRTFGSLLDLLDVDINSIRNECNDSLLHSALDIRGCTTEFVGFLIDRGIEIHAVDRFGDTPLDIVLQREDKRQPPRLDLIEMLLKKGSLVRARNHVEDTSLDYAICIDCCFDVRKLLLKYIILQDSDFNLDGWVQTHRQCMEIKSYGNYCKRELRRMSSEIVGNERTLFEFLQTYSASQMSANGENGFHVDRLLQVISKKKYPLYSNVIVSKLGHSLLKHKLEDCRVRTVVRTRTGVKYVKREISLNFNCACVVANYLEETDLLNMIVAFRN